MFLLALILVNISCISETKQNSMTTKDQSINKQNQNTFKNEPIYVIEVSSSSPYELYVNDIMIDQYYEKGAIDYSLEINQWLLSSGTIPIKAKIFPKKDSHSSVIETSAISYFEIKLSVFEKKKEKINRVLLDVFKFNIPETIPSNSYSNTWKYEFKVPYNLKGWSNSVTLEKNEELLKETLQLYNTLKDVLNSGDINKYFSIYKNANEEFYGSNYFDKNEIKNEEEAMAIMVKNAVNNTKLDTDYNLKLYGNNKLVTLELRDGLSPVFSDDGTNLEYFSLLLHRPSPEAPLEVIR